MIWSISVNVKMKEKLPDNSNPFILVTITNKNKDRKEFKDVPIVFHIKFLFCTIIYLQHYAIFE